MITTKRHRSKQTPENASSGVIAPGKHTRMTPQRAHIEGKHGKADLHMHSTYSDGGATIEQILAYTQHSTNLDVIAITDHDVIESALRARDLWAQGSYRFDLVVGEEVTTAEGHLLGLFIEKHVPAGLSMERSIDLIHAQGGLAVIAHPLHRFFRHSCQRKVMDRIHTSKDVWFDGIETWNASFCGIYANYIAMSANRTVYGLPELGNSDAHTLNSIGYGLTWFEGQSAQDVRASIEKGQTAPGGKLWDAPVYLDLMRYRFSKEGRQNLRSHVAIA